MSICNGWGHEKFFADQHRNSGALGLSPRRIKALRMWWNGARLRLKICEVILVRVRVPPSAPTQRQPDLTQATPPFLPRLPRLS